MKSYFKMTWDENDIAKAFKITPADVREYLTDGRRVSFIIERRLKWEHKGWELARSEGAGYDLRDPQGQYWEVRSITKRGVYFNPSNQVGSGRSFEENGFFEKLNSINGFILADIFDFPTVILLKIDSEIVRRWYDRGLLGRNARISREKFWKLPDIPSSEN